MNGYEINISGFVEKPTTENNFKRMSYKEKVSYLQTEVENKQNEIAEYETSYTELTEEFNSLEEYEKFSINNDVVYNIEVYHQGGEDPMGNSEPTYYKDFTAKAKEIYKINWLNEDLSHDGIIMIKTIDGYKGNWDAPSYIVNNHIKNISVAFNINVDTSDHTTYFDTYTVNISENNIENLFNYLSYSPNPDGKIKFTEEYVEPNWANYNDPTEPALRDNYPDNTNDENDNSGI